MQETAAAQPIVLNLCIAWWWARQLPPTGSVESAVLRAVSSVVRC